MASILEEQLNREECLFLAKLSEEATRHDQMKLLMRKLVLSTTPNGELTREEMHLLLVAWKNVVDPLRDAWRTCGIAEKREMERADSNNQRIMLIQRYRASVGSEISKECGDILDLLASHLFPSVQNSENKEAKAFYYKMKGDFHRYVLELQDRDSQEWAKIAANTLQSYKETKELTGNLPATNTLKLGLLLNFSTFYYQDLHDPFEASHVAIKAYEAGVSELLETGAPREGTPSSVLMQILRDNIISWGSENPDSVDKTPWRMRFFD